MREDREALLGVIEGMQIIIAKLEEDNRILRQYQRIAIHDKEHRKKILQDYMRVNQQLTDKIVELNG